MSLEKTLNVVDIGLVKYEHAFDLQIKLAGLRANDDIDDTLILVEHPAVITQGVRGNGDEILDREELKILGISVYECERGGSSFLHSPGQIVGYPIRLAKLGNKQNYMMKLQETMIDVAREYRIRAVKHPRKSYIGAWYNIGGNLYHKIGAVGVKFKNINQSHVTIHGFAFNVNNDTYLFKNIKMCGCEVESAISLRDILGYEVEIEDVQEKLVTRLKENLGYSSVQRYANVDELIHRKVIA